MDVVECCYSMSAEGTGGLLEGFLPGYLE